MYTVWKDGKKQNLISFGDFLSCRFCVGTTRTGAKIGECLALLETENIVGKNGCKIESNFTIMSLLYARLNNRDGGNQTTFSMCLLEVWYNTHNVQNSRIHQMVRNHHHVLYKIGITPSDECSLTNMTNINQSHACFCHNMTWLRQRGSKVFKIKQGLWTETRRKLRKYTESKGNDKNLLFHETKRFFKETETKPKFCEGIFASILNHMWTRLVRGRGS
jgi:hypothetical protein